MLLVLRLIFDSLPNNNTFSFSSFVIIHTLLFSLLQSPFSILINLCLLLTLFHLLFHFIITFILSLIKYTRSFSSHSFTISFLVTSLSSLFFPGGPLFVLLRPCHISTPCFFPSFRSLSLHCIHLPFYTHYSHKIITIYVFFFLNI
ncbi:hypothetical protein V8G54_000652, partial [Vigna mungo]